AEDISSDLGQGALRKRLSVAAENRPSPEEEFPGGRIVETAEQMYESGLAGPGRTGERDEFSLVDLERNVADSGDLFVSALIDFGQVLRFQGNRVAVHSFTPLRIASRGLILPACQAG